MNQGWIRIHRSRLIAYYRLLDLTFIFGTLLACLFFLDHTLTKDWFIAALLATIFFAVLSESFELYRSWRIDSYLKMCGKTFLAWGAVCSLLLLIAYFAKVGEHYSRLVIGLWFLTTLVVLNLWRFTWRQVLFSLRMHGRNVRQAVIIGVTDSGIKLYEDFASSPQLGITVKGFYSADVKFPESEVSQTNKAKVNLLGTVEDAVALAKVGELDLVYIALPMREEEAIGDILTRFGDTTATVHILPNFFVANMLHARWHQVGRSNLLSIYDTPIEGFNSWLKRLEDLVLGTLILILLSPVMLFVSAGVLISSPGPVLFKQRRYGLDGRTIDVWKFRSMVTQDNGVQVKQATRNDARITKFGSFIRRTSLDELPQLFNVIQGHMSIVGPRPHAVAHNEEYRRLINGYMLRHKVRPGITGWAQINGWRGETDTLDKMSKRIEYDLHYIRNWSLFFDFRILFLTIFRGFVSKNAY
ncbi:undecaprenyl-phosphate glucose phosphotransferase [Microbulbifer sp. YPW1]|uniref:undecaprenyl-phosphate glucose phosphotransferase n=1 Tax=Microbulbifer sp. YPW1 TaxID=2745199 RepID=UPI001598B435|nr:undecaprenyl-phosphate glucose phosphotransferase [Microbulbifer sp. YPW1]QKX16578.1 undecaprenyl-phosphate glucose phosphotransferase [Microbulbifer sp. YPW1]